MENLRVDYMTVWVNGVKKKERKLYLTVYLKEAYYIFKQLNPSISLGFSRFCELRPSHVVLLKQQPVDQCKCKTHENFFLKLKALKFSYTNDLWGYLLCNVNNLKGDCWKGKCNVCSKISSLDFESKAEKEQIIWEEWDKTEGGRLKIHTRQGCRSDLIDQLQQELENITEHVRIKRIQANAFELDKNDDNSSVLQCDFSMAYSCEYQNEIQSALWSRQSINLFTAALYAKSQPCKSLLVVLDTIDKGKNTVYTCLTKLLEHFIDEGIDLGTHLTIFTDGPSSEFKNKYIIKVIHNISDSFGLSIKWKYFATSHGKGVVDGIGGTAKSMVRQSVMSRKEIVQSSVDFARVVTKCMPGVHIIHVDSAYISKFIETKRPWDNVIDVSGISKVHSVICQKGEISMFNTDVDTEVIQFVNYMKLPNNDVYKEDDWVLVKYEKEIFPGVIFQMINNNCEVSVMHKSSSNKFRWPEKIDKIFYHRSNILKLITAPVPVDARGHYVFNESFES